MTNMTLEQLARKAAEDLRAAEFRADQAEFELDQRAKYTSDEKQQALSAGHAIANANGDPSYVIKDADDLGKAIRAVGRGGTDHDAIRQHIMKRAQALGLYSQIPDNWNHDGSLKDATQANAAPVDPTAEMRQVNRYVEIVNPAADSDVRSDRTADYRKAPETAEERKELRAVRTDILAPLYAFLLTLDADQRFLTWANYDEEVRDALLSYNDIEDAVEDALSAKLGDNDGDYDFWVCDAGEGWAIFNSYIDPPGMGLWKVTYDLDDDCVVHFTSEPVAVARVTTYEEVPVPEVPSLVAETLSADATATELRIRMNLHSMRLDRGPNGQFGGTPAAHKVGDSVTAPKGGATGPAKVTAVSGNQVTVKHEDGTTATHPSHEVTPVVKTPAVAPPKPATGAPAGSNFPPKPATGAPAGSNFPGTK